MCPLSPVVVDCSERGRTLEHHITSAGQPAPASPGCDTATTTTRSARWRQARASLDPSVVLHFIALKTGPQLPSYCTTQRLFILCNPKTTFDPRDESRDAEHWWIITETKKEKLRTVNYTICCLAARNNTDCHCKIEYSLKLILF